VEGRGDSLLGLFRSGREVLKVLNSYANPLQWFGCFELVTKKQLLR
jgi:hypothetical protein